MITQLLKRRIAPDRFYVYAVQGSVAFFGAVMFVAGFRKLADLELTEAQLLLGAGVIFSLALQCVTISVLLSRKLKRG